MTDYLQYSTDHDNARVASGFDQLSFWASRFGALLFDHIPIERAPTVLDLGCGTGFPLIELAQIHDRAARFLGVDTWASALRRARAKRNAWHLENVHLVRGDGAALPFADGEFDLIVSNLGVNNFERPRAALRECARVARPGARLVLTTNLSGHMAEFYDAFRQVLCREGMTEAVDRLGEEESHRGSEKILREWLAGAGFAVTRAIHETFTLRYADGGTLFRHALTVFGFLDGWKSVVPAADQARVFSLLEAGLDEHAAREGELRLTVPMLYLEGQRAG